MTATITIDDAHAQRVAAVGYTYKAHELVTKCPLCGGADLRSLHNRDRLGFAAESTLCNTCSFVFLSPRMTAERYADFYQHWYRKLVSAHCGRDVCADTLDASHSDYAHSVVQAIASFAGHPTRRTALDIGGSTGIFAAELASRWGYRCTVLDPSPDELAVAHRKGCETIEGLVEDFDDPRKFDVVSMLQTVDHLLDLPGTLQKCHGLLSPHGIFVIDFIDWQYQYRHYGVQQAIKIDHPLYFSPDTAVCALARHGFEPLIRSRHERHLLFVCRPVPPLPHALPSDESIAVTKAELAEVLK